MSQATFGLIYLRILLRPLKVNSFKYLQSHVSYKLLIMKLLPFVLLSRIPIPLNSHREIDDR